MSSSHAFSSCTDTEARWLDQIHSSLTDYQGCTGEHCDCHGDVINNDLEVWRERGGVMWEEFEAVKTSMRGVHYQIIDHILYREEACMFNSRLALCTPQVL